ncbi:hypothetical protein N658DRAFT_415652 [Parathielavia hyrcaniae]|uniref:Nonsense-mediated mRNA decay factor n=1 Tax=Parathielavia hyrcaniae TaxID=113614 RepID=A0AAN6QC64_9PEZI|nr:hypothetical protein N658DRAFT_415652 [Parathielavia hyrcaniae]
MASTTTAAAATMATMPSIDEAWQVAQKLRTAIHKELEQVQKVTLGTSELARFEKVEKLMENYRLACIETIWPDIRASNEKAAEDVLWQTHTLVAKAYRKVLSRLQGHDHVVFRRKLEKLYTNYLKTAQYFYRGYFQRVCARYNMKDLQRIARRAELEEMPVPDKDKVDAAAAGLKDIVRRSCHKTLIYLGDLARYRTLLRSKDRQWDGALAYYLLANELNPDSGYGHHQCSVIYIETEDHLQVVYHLYLALACTVPHPNAPMNLEREFRELQNRKSFTTKHALVTWFVKLHAFYSQGTEFTERKELEREVDHRLAIALKTGTGYSSDTDLLKMVLINITAYVAAHKKIQEKWTEEGSQSCQFILLLNLRTIHAIGSLLGEEIKGIINRSSAEAPVAASGSSSGSKFVTKFTVAFNRVLPLLRVYMTWLCFYSSELVLFRPHLEPQFGAMCKTLGNALTMLFELLATDQQLGNTVSWRFPEDEITLGIKCLNGPELHDGCQLHYDAFTRQPKPRREDVSGSAQDTEDDVTFTRAMDSLLCALDLSAAESKFPLTNSTTTKGSQELTTFEYLEGGKPELAANPPQVQHSTPTPVPAVTEQTPQRPVVAPSPGESNKLSEDKGFYGPGLRHAVANGAGNGIGIAEAPIAAQPTPIATASEFPIDRQMFNILNDFINPPESAPVAKQDNPIRPPASMSPYGMGSPAVAKAFGAGPSSSPVSGSAGGKAFPTLPWEYFYKPAPVDSALRNPNANGAGTAWGAGGTGFPRPTSSSNGNTLGRESHKRHDISGQARLVDNQADALQSLGLGSGHANQQHQGCAARGAWSNALAEGSTTARGQSSFWAPPASPWQATYGQNGATASRVPNSPFSTLNFSTNTSSLPQVNNPWGLPTTAQRPTAAHAWPDARRHARTGSGQQDIWGPPIPKAGVDARTFGSKAMMQQQGMPKR